MTKGRTVAVVGVGRVGLPLCLSLAEAGHTVHGIDVDPARIETVREGRMPFLEVGAEPLLKRHAGKRFLPTTDFAVAAKADDLILTIGTPVDEHMNPIFSQLERAVEALLPHLRAGHAIFLRSTVSPGTTNWLRRHLETRTKLKVGRDLALAFCPERIAEGKAIEELPKIPQIVGADDDLSRTRARALFATVTPEAQETDSVSAELSKLFTNMYRYIDFAIANEFMMIAQDHNREIYPILSLVNRGYARGGLKSPGLTGGPCLFKDGFFLVSRTPYAELISLAWKVNETTPAFLIERLKRQRPLEGCAVALLGLAFKKNIDDTRNSLSCKARKLFLQEGCTVRSHDPFLPGPAVEEALRGADVVFLAMNHDAYRDLDWKAAARLVAPDALFCDVWNLLGTGRILFPGEALLQ
ncbi:MAG: nucleotide sugar dehydrogenase [Planctomycetes bacterium]|nr:nucleotide sugar dehydrogenase [Planctomycetota bacterium]